MGWKFRRKRELPPAPKGNLTGRIIALGLRPGSRDGEARWELCHPDASSSHYRMVVDLGRIDLASDADRAYIVGCLAAQACGELGDRIQGSARQIELTATLALYVGALLSTGDVEHAFGEVIR